MKNFLIAGICFLIFFSGTLLTTYANYKDPTIDGLGLAATGLYLTAFGIFLTTLSIVGIAYNQSVFKTPLKNLPYFIRKLFSFLLYCLLGILTIFILILIHVMVVELLFG
jgi:hypothetical protein